MTTEMMGESGRRTPPAAGEQAGEDARQRQQQQLREALAVELDERVQALNQLLLELERPEDAPVDPAGGADNRRAAPRTMPSSARRTASRGRARMVGLRGMEQLAHAFESALTTARQQGSRPTDAWFKAAYRAADTFHELQYATQEGDEQPPAGLADVLVALARVAGPGDRRDGDESAGFRRAPAAPAAPAARQPRRRPVAPAAPRPRPSPTSVSPVRTPAPLARPPRPPPAPSGAGRRPRAFVLRSASWTASWPRRVSWP